MSADHPHRDLPQPSLFDGEPPTSRPESVGEISVSYGDASSILTPASGFMSAYDYTLNPYVGCSFGCRYCYAAFFSRDEDLQQSWGDWVSVKQNAIELLRKKRRSSIQGRTIYMSSATDPYQPIERHLELTRALLQELIPHQPRLVIQTRSGLATRDIDLFQQFEHVRVNMTINTDDEEVRRSFEPRSPTSAVRLRAIKEITDAGIDTCITMTPLLPLLNPESFAKSLRSTGVQRFVVQRFHPQRGRFIAGTSAEANAILEHHHWSQESYVLACRTIRHFVPSLEEGQAGFEPA